MNNTISKFYKLGILSSTAFNQYMGNILQEDEKIKNILAKLNVNRNVNYIDRANYKTWKNDWQISDELLDYATTLSQNKDNPLKYLSRVLADWHEKGIKNVDEAKSTSPLYSNEQSKKDPDKNFTGRSYSSEEWNALYQSIDEIEI